MYIIKSIPSPNGKNTLNLYVDNAQLLLERGDLDYFNDRNGSGRIVSNNNSSFSKFYLETPNKQVFFNNFECLYNYGAFSWWDNYSRYFYLVFNTQLIFIFDCQENKWSKISTSFEIISAYIINDEVKIDGIKISFSATDESRGVMLATYKLSDLIWKDDNIEIIKKTEKEKIEENAQTIIKKRIIKNISQELTKNIKVFAILLIIFILIGVSALFGREHILIVRIALVSMAIIPFLYINEFNKNKDIDEKIYKAWLIKKFGFWIPLFTIITTSIISAFSDEYRTSMFNSLTYAFSFFYPFYVFFSEFQGIIHLNNNLTHKQHCKYRYKDERNKGKSLIRFFLDINLKKLLYFFIFVGAIGLIVYTTSSIISYLAD